MKKYRQERECRIQLRILQYFHIIHFIIGIDWNTWNLSLMKSNSRYTLSKTKISFEMTIIFVLIIWFECHSWIQLMLANVCGCWYCRTYRGIQKVCLNGRCKPYYTIVCAINSLLSIRMPWQTKSIYMNSSFDKFDYFIL